MLSCFIILEKIKGFFIVLFLISTINLFSVDIKKNYEDFRDSSKNYLTCNKVPLTISACFLCSSFLLDKSIRKIIIDNRLKPLIKISDFTNNFGEYKYVLPGLAFVGTYGMIRDDKIYKTSKIAFESCFLAGSLNLATKFLVGRERPSGSNNPFIFKPFSLSNKYNSFFSGHSTIAWSVFTPFALAYNNPYIFIIPFTVKFSRIYKNQHWFSDNIASGIIGFSSGYILYHMHSDKKFKISFSPNSMNLSYKF